MQKVIAHMAEKLKGIFIKQQDMKKMMMALIVFAGITACSDNPGTGNREYQMPTQNQQQGDTTGNSAGDTTATSNNNVYNTDSATGQGNRYDSSSRQ